MQEELSAIARWDLVDKALWLGQAGKVARGSCGLLEARMSAFVAPGKEF